jgi:hypothetical protein
MKTRITVYINCEGDVFYRPQFKLPLLPIYWRYTGTDCYSWWIEEFVTLAEAEKFLKVKYSKAREKKLAKRKFFKAINYKE